MTMVKLYNGHSIIDLSTDDIPSDAGMLLKLGTMCSDGRVEERDGKQVHIGDPTETGIVAATMKYCGMNREEIDNAYPRMGEIPFDSDRKLMTTINMIDGKPFAVVKGAPDIIISRCTTCLLYTSTQRRGGRGITGMSTREEDFAEYMLTCMSHDNIMLFTNTCLLYTSQC